MLHVDIIISEFLYCQISMIKKVFESKLFRIVVSVILIYFAFRKVNILNILEGFKGIPIKWIVFHILYTLVVVVIGSYRWSVLLFEKTNFQKVKDFTKASLMGAFYGLFFPTGVAADLLKWLPLQKKYPEITKVKLFSSVFLDRFIGFSAFIILAFVSTSIGKFTNFSFPDYLFWIFGGLSAGVLLFYVLVFTIDLEKIMDIFIKKIKILEKVKDIISLLKHGNRKKIIQCFLISLASEMIWITQVWFVSNIFNAGFTILSVFMFLPVIALILLLPISIAGFGAREQLYLFFFSQVATGDEKILLVSTFMGLLGVINSLWGGLVAWF